MLTWKVKFGIKLSKSVTVNSTCNGLHLTYEGLPHKLLNGIRLSCPNFEAETVK